MISASVFYFPLVIYAYCCFLPVDKRYFFVSMCNSKLAGIRLISQEVHDHICQVMINGVSLSRLIVLKGYAIMNNYEKCLAH